MFVLIKNPHIPFSQFLRHFVHMPARFRMKCQVVQAGPAPVVRDIEEFFLCLEEKEISFRELPSGALLPVLKELITQLPKQPQPQKSSDRSKSEAYNSTW